MYWFILRSSRMEKQAEGRTRPNQKNIKSQSFPTRNLVLQDTNNLQLSSRNQNNLKAFHIRFHEPPSSITMHFAKFLALVGVFAMAAVAAPNKPTKPPQPPPPPPPPPPTQQNACGNGATPYCCNTDSKGAYGSCYTYRTLIPQPIMQSASLSLSLDRSKERKPIADMILRKKQSSAPSAA